MIEFYIMPNEDALAQAMHLDRTFFELNPKRNDYCRLAIPGEDFGFFPPKTLVHVVNCGEGTRWRAFYRPPEEIWMDLEREMDHQISPKAR
jgi:hypothetical protein